MFNDSKYQTLRIGKNIEKYYNEYIYMTPDFSQPIDDYESLRDLGVIMSSKGGFQDHITHIISKVKQKMGWIHRTFLTNNVEFRRFTWVTRLIVTLQRRKRKRKKKFIN